jgi:hypothetical protein
MFVLVLGLAIRIGLALFTGHAYDMFLWTYSARLFYESNVFDTHFPTLPLLYYLQLASYSFYAFLRMLGLQDARFLYHPNYMVEGLFLKLPMILSDVGLFFLITRFTKNLFYGALFYFNPFIIYLSAAWGMYDSIMMLPLVYGLLLLSRNEQRRAAIYFGIAGLAKLFGFIPFAMMLIDEIGRRNWRLMAFHIGILVVLGGMMFAPFSSVNPQSFLVGIVFRVTGLGGAEFPVWNIAAVSGTHFFFGANVMAVFAITLVLALFLIQRRTSRSLFVLTLRWSLVAAALIDVFSQAQPQWSSWVIPLAVIYSSVTRRQGLAYYSYFYGVVATLLTTLMTQGLGFLFTGLNIVLLPGLELFQNSLAVYATTVLSMQIVLLWRIFRPSSALTAKDLAFVITTCGVSYLLFAVLQL